MFVGMENTGKTYGGEIRAFLVNEKSLSWVGGSVKAGLTEPGSVLALTSILSPKVSQKLQNSWPIVLSALKTKGVSGTCNPLCLSLSFQLLDCWLMLNSNASQWQGWAGGGWEVRSAACFLPSLVKSSGLDRVAGQNVERKHYFS